MPAAWPTLTHRPSVIDRSPRPNAGYSDTNMNQQIPFNELQRLFVEKQQEVDNIQKLMQAAQANHQLNLYPAHGDFRAPIAQYQPQLHHNAVPQGRKAAMSRSKSNMSYSTASTRMMEHTSDMDSPQPMKRPRVMSQPMTGMSRSTSNRSEKSIPFVVKGPLAPLQTSNTTANTMMDRFYQSHDDPPVMFQQPSHTLQRAPSNRRQSSLPRVEENMDFGMDIAEYLAMHDENIPSPALVPPQPAFLMPDGRNSQASLVASACPSMSSGTSGPETMPLTRENSSFDHHIENQSLSGAFVEMARIDSTQSQFDFMNQEAFPAGPLGTSPLGKPESYLAHVGGAGLYLQHAQPSPMEENFLSQGSSLMERSISANSTASTKSTQERRAKEVFQQQIQNGRTTLLPKPADSGKRSQSSATKKEGKVAVAKGTYTRPKHPKVFCDMCNEHPDGFRGDHELRRHISAKHEGVIKKFICRDPATVGIKSNVEAINPLSKCKQCVGGKHYGAYYNAAAHLRRTHFKPKTPRGKNKRGDDDEKRGGKGGGDWPSMNELKSWMEEVFVRADEAASSGAEAQDEDEEETAQFTDASMPIDLSLGHMGENMPFDMTLPGSYSMPPELASIDTQASSYLAVSDMPLSSASEAFALSPFPNSPMNGLPHETAFSISSSNTVTPTTYLNTMPDGFDSYSQF